MHYTPFRLLALLPFTLLISCSRSPSGGPSQQPLPPPVLTSPLLPSAPAPTFAPVPGATPITVNFPGQGQIQFPAGMSQASIDRITNAIRKAAQSSPSPAGAASPQ
jgi:hypothetical protein